MSWLGCCQLLQLVSFLVLLAPVTLCPPNRCLIMNTLSHCAFCFWKIKPCNFIILRSQTAHMGIFWATPAFRIQTLQNYFLKLLLMVFRNLHMLIYFSLVSNLSKMSPQIITRHECLRLTKSSARVCFIQSPYYNHIIFEMSTPTISCLFYAWKNIKHVIAVVFVERSNEIVSWL